MNPVKMAAREFTKIHMIEMTSNHSFARASI